MFEGQYPGYGAAAYGYSEPYGSSMGEQVPAGGVLQRVSGRWSMVHLDLPKGWGPVKTL